MVNVPNPQRVPVIGSGGFVTREWLRFFESLTAASATTSSGSTTTVDLTPIESDIDDLQAAVATILTSLAALSLPAEVLTDDQGRILMDDLGNFLTQA